MLDNTATATVDPLSRRRYRTLEWGTIARWDLGNESVRDEQTGSIRGRRRTSGQLSVPGELDILRVDIIGRDESNVTRSAHVVASRIGALELHYLAIHHQRFEIALNQSKISATRLRDV
jgi:hypothetical protein